MTDILEWKLQFGAFAIAAMLIGLLVWYIRFNTSFLRDLFHSHQKIQSETNDVLGKTRDAITINRASTDTLTTQLDRMDKTQNRLLREMLSRPCLIDAVVHDKALANKKDAPDA